jgi:signal transduction histidine kinase
MITNQQFSTPKRLLVLFLVVAGIPFAALAWLGWRSLEQDRTLENQRSRERLENAASLLAHELDRGLASWEELIPSVAQGVAIELPLNSVLLVFDSGGIVRHQGVRLPYYPLVGSQHVLGSSIFAAAESLEFREQDFAKAAGLYRNLGRVGDRRVRATALMRLARCLRKMQQTKDALAVYSELAAFGEIPVAGSPSELLARRERIALLETAGDREGRNHESALLRLALWSGKFRIDRATFEFYRESLEPVQPATAPALTLAEAVEALWPIWQQQPSGRTAWSGGGSGFAAVWRPTPAGTAALVAGVDALLASARPAIQNLKVALALEDRGGHLVWGELPKASPQVLKPLQETGLPWTLKIASLDPSSGPAVSSARRNLLVTGFALILLVIAAASYFVLRAVNRELSVARLQSDFVAAVSHEFRTPLTAMSHLTELLEEGGVAAERVPFYYRALAKETRRLRGMVESLLDFGRMEAGRRTYHIEDIDAVALVRQVVEDFREQVSTNAHCIEMSVAANGGRIRADREAFTVALWNLLDNAVKYSGEGSTVKVSVATQGEHLAISVEDQGVGIAKREQREVFRKFVRGISSRSLNVKGSGIGLAMVDYIVNAHRGRIDLESEPGHGSRFTILLPVERDHQ